MSAELELTKRRPARSHDLTTEKTSWGLVLHQPTTIARFAGPLEGAMMALSLACALGVIGLWVVPSASGPEVVTFKLAVSLAASVFALAFWSAAARGFRFEIWIDRKDGVMQQVRRNARGRTKILATTPLGEVESFFIQRLCVMGKPSQLFARIKGARDAIHLGSGRVAELERIHNQLLNVDGRDVATMLAELSNRADRTVQPAPSEAA